MCDGMARRPGGHGGSAPVLKDGGIFCQVRTEGKASLSCGMRDTEGTGLRMLRGGPEVAGRGWHREGSRQWVCRTAADSEPD